MNRLECVFAGLALKSPVIVSSSGLTDSAEKNRRWSECGAGAIVLKSLFEEQISAEAEKLEDFSGYPEGSEYLKEYVRAHRLSEYLSLIRESKSVCSVPVIASVSCYTDSGWADFAARIEEAGADALEINVMALRADKEYTYGLHEQRHIDILKHVKKVVQIPVIVKLGNNLSNPVALINQLYANGAAAVVLFNRFYQPDIDIDSMEYVTGDVFTHPSDLSTPLRWIGIASSLVGGIDYAASGGVSSSEAVVKALLAGASAVEVCSAIYKDADFIGKANRFLNAWMERNGFEKIAQFKGKLSNRDLKGINAFERVQFLKYFDEH